MTKTFVGTSLLSAAIASAAAVACFIITGFSALRVAFVLRAIRKVRLRRCRQKQQQQLTHDDDYHGIINNSKGHNYDDSFHENMRKIYSNNADTNLSSFHNSNRQRETTTASSTRVAASCHKTMIVLGSGGHTTEMLLLLKSLNPTIDVNDESCDHDYLTNVVYVIANSDTTTMSKLLAAMKEMEQRQDEKAEKILAGKNGTTVTCSEELAMPKRKRNFEIFHLPRARELHQSYISSIFTTLNAFYRSVLLLWETKPQLILANGPGTCVPIIYGAFVLSRIFPLNHLRRLDDHCKIVYIESVCRVRTLSLSGKLVYPIVDSFIVHWPKLAEQYDMAELCDTLVPLQ